MLSNAFSVLLVLPLAISPIWASEYHADFEGRDIQPTGALPATAGDPAPTVVPATPPDGPAEPRNVNGGVLTCLAGHISVDDPEFYMTRDEAAAAIGSFCKRIPAGVVFKSIDGTPFQYTQADGPFEQPMFLSAVWNGGDSCPTTDFSNSTSKAVCKQILLGNIVDNCELRPRQDQTKKPN